MGDSVVFARVQVPGCCLWMLRVRSKSLASIAEDVLVIFNSLVIWKFEKVDEIAISRFAVEWKSDDQS